MVYKLSFTLLSVYFGMLPPVVCSTLLYLVFEVRDDLDDLVTHREFYHKEEVQEALFQSSPS